MIVMFVLILNVNISYILFESSLNQNLFSNGNQLRMCEFCLSAMF